MNTYVVCMDSSWVRDSQMFDIVGLTDDELAEVDMCGTENERRWHDMEPTPFIAVIKRKTRRKPVERQPSKCAMIHAVCLP